MANKLEELIEKVNKITEQEKENEIVKKGRVSNESYKGLRNFKPDKNKTTNQNGQN